MTAERLLAGVLKNTGAVLNSAQKQIVLRRLVLDSREIQSADVFVALAGTQTDGRRFITAAFALGAAAVLVEEAAAGDDERVIAVPQLRRQLSQIAGELYAHPSKKMQVFAITGTNGKTTTSQLIAAALHKRGANTFVAGTLGYGLYGALQAGRHTTPDAIAMQRLLATGLAAGAAYASMEVSSHGLDQGRVEALQFHTAIFSNLTRDHLDYHGTMEAYGAAKRRLFSWPALQHAVINADDAFGRELLADQTISASRWAYSLRHLYQGPGISGCVHAEKIHYSHAGILAEVVTPWGRRLLQSPLLGEFNLSNLLAALTALCASGLPLDEVILQLGTVPPIAGRMERFGDKHQPMIVVDYAHTPDALEKAVMAMRLHTTGRVGLIFGCGGDRDSGKRPEMGRIAERLANRVIVSNDNPRSELPETIAADIHAGMHEPQKAPFIADRETALRTLLADFGAGDAILLAGKGHEAYIEMNAARTPYSEVEMVRRVLAETGTGERA